MPGKSEKHDATSFPVSTSSPRKHPVSPSLPSTTGESETPALNSTAVPPMSTAPMLDPFDTCSSSASALQAKAEELQPELFSLQSLLEQRLTEPDWVIPGLLPTGVSLLAGPAQVDKPLLANQLGLSVASGLPFLERFPVRQGRVLYLALAEDFQQIRGRALRLLRGQEHPDSFTFALKWSPFRSSGLADLEDTLMTLSDARLVIIDPLEYLLPLPAVQNYRVRQVPTREPGFFLPLRNLAARYSLAILLLHHLPDNWPVNRQDPLAGLSPTGLTPASACNLLLTPACSSGDSTLHIAGMQVEERRLVLAFDGQSGQWRCIEPET